jgi:hypothetical protein
VKKNGEITKYLAKFQSPRPINSAKNHWTGTIHPHIKSISQSIAKKSGEKLNILQKFQSSRAITWPKIIGPE